MERSTLSLAGASHTTVDFGQVGSFVARKLESMGRTRCTELGVFRIVKVVPPRTDELKYGA